MSRDVIETKLPVYLVEAEFYRTWPFFTLREEKVNYITQNIALTTRRRMLYPLQGIRLG